MKAANAPKATGFSGPIAGLRARDALASLLWCAGFALCAIASAPSHTEPFAPAEVHSINGVSISSDGLRLYATQWRDDATSPRNARRAEIVEYRAIDGAWTAPRTAPFSGRYDDAEACESLDGRWVYFASRRPKPGSKENWGAPNIWRCRRGEDGAWGEPEYLTAVNSTAYDGYPCLTADGSLYFSSNRPGGPGDVDIYVSRLRNDEHDPPELVESLSSPLSDNDPYVSPDGRIVLFTRNRDARFEQIDLFVSVRQDDRWLAPIPIESVRRPGWNLSPLLTPDGRLLIYNSSQAGLRRCAWPVTELTLLEVDQLREAKPHQP